MDTNDIATQQPAENPELAAQQVVETEQSTTEKEALLAEAKALGLPANASWGIDAIKRNIDAKKAELAAQQAAEEAQKAAEASIIEPLDVYIQRVERVHLDNDVFAVEVTHPEVKGEFYTGLYSGIRLKQGDKPSVKYSNGTVE